MYVCVYMFKYIYEWSVYDKHICLYVWCICDTHLCIYSLECMHVWRMKSWEERNMYAYAHILTLGFVCVNLYMHVYIGMSMFMYGYILCLNIMHVYLCRHIYVLLYTWVCIHMHGYIWASTYMYIQMCKCKSLCMGGVICEGITHPDAGITINSLSPLGDKDSGVPFTSHFALETAWQSRVRR